MQVSGRVALVTGASSGIGRAIAAELSQRGAQVKATGRDERALRDLASRTGAEVFPGDLGDAEGVDGVAAWAAPVDILINNAGIGWAGPFQEMKGPEMDELVRVNLLAPLLLTRALVSQMVARGEGYVVNVSSIAGHVGVGQEAVYAATKAALVGFTESLSHELAGTGVRTLLVSPGVVDTPFFERAGRAYTRRFPKPIESERVAMAVVRAIERDRTDVFVPGWMALPARLRGAFPGLYRALAARFGAASS
jgi:short-subunit dehydrogenase